MSKTEFVKIPIKIVNKEQWGRLSVYGPRHTFCGEDIRIKNETFSFAGGHRVRFCNAVGNVHWLIPGGIKLDISQVPPAKAPPMKPPRRMPKK